MQVYFPVYFAKSNITVQENEVIGNIVSRWKSQNKRQASNKKLNTEQ